MPIIQSPCTDRRDTPHRRLSRRCFRALRAGSLTVAFACVAGLALAQGPGERGSSPPGSSRDGGRPADGAIRGGSVAPPDAGNSQTAERDAARCNELSGALRDQCLRDLGSAGSTRSPGQGSRGVPGRDPAEPPPQNPRGSQ
jgi:hypothetical protein